MADPSQNRPGYFGREFLTQLVQRLDGPAFIGRFIQVITRGDRHYAVCPFHKDSKPSLLIRTDGSFHCFGCHKSGSVFNFLMERNALTFPEAVTEVAQFTGTPLPQSSGRTGPTKEQLAMYEALKDCAKFFKEQLDQATSNSPVKRYLAMREVDPDTLEKYQIGYAPNTWTSIKDRNKQVSEQLLIDADLLVHNRDKNSVYDRYRHRLMFPIRDRQGRVVGFGGRVLDDAVEPKYLNTKQTKVFTKGRELYGLYETLQQPKRPERLLLVEGYMDVVALSQHGIPYAVAALGTASNANHFQTMFWSTNEVVCCFDGDDAGRLAARRALEVALSVIKEEKTVRFMFLPSDEDPDSFVRKHGKEAFEREVESAQHVADYFVSGLVDNRDRSFESIEAKARFVDRAINLIQKVSQPTMRKILTQEVAQCFPEQVNMQALLQPAAVADDEPPPDEPSYEEMEDFEPVSRAGNQYEQEINTRRRVSQLLCAPNIWPRLNEHRELLERLVHSAPDHPLTRVWLAIDRHHFTDIHGLIASFQEDAWFTHYLNDIYDPQLAPAMIDVDTTLGQFTESVQTFITTLEKKVHSEIWLNQFRAAQK
ncbi:MAG: DNA primase [Gammaproteobacteria bacterium]|nr:DNA primase [Gammaproteobacteria bacterium]